MNGCLDPARVGVVATTPRWMPTQAPRLAPAGTIAPLRHLETVGAAVIGYLAVGDFPTPHTVLGIAIVAGAGAGGPWSSASAAST